MIHVNRRCTITSNHLETSHQPGSSGASSHPPNKGTWEYVEDWFDGGGQIRAAILRADELNCPPITKSTAAVLRLLTTTIGARTVVEVGTGCGLSTAALLSGMAEDGVLTSIDVDAENQKAARETLNSLGYETGRARLIHGRALNVLPRLTDKGYDLIFVDADKSEYTAILEQARRLLRIGGILVFDNVLSRGNIADPSDHNPETLGMRDVATELRDDEEWVPAILTVGHGLLVAVLRGPLMVGEVDSTSDSTFPA